MNGFKEFGVAMTGVFPVREAVELAKTAEKLGFGSVWFAEDYFFRGGIPYITAAGMVTDKIRIGLGVINPYTRHPALIAMEFATVDELTNKRCVFGLGSGVPFWMSQMGYEFKKPLSRTKECVRLVRLIMSGESINFNGQFYNAKDIQLIFDPVRKDPPIFLAFEGKMGLKLAGEIGDGVILSIFNTPSYIKFAWERIRKGAKAADRSLDDFEMVSYLPMVIDDDLDRAFKVAREFMKLYVPHAPLTSPLMEHAGVTQDQLLAFKDALQKKENVGALITDKMIQTLGVIGDIDSCIKQIQDIVDAGANTPVLFPVPGTDVIETTTVLSKEVVPNLR